MTVCHSEWVASNASGELVQKTYGIMYLTQVRKCAAGSSSGRPMPV